MHDEGRCTRCAMLLPVVLLGCGAGGSDRGLSGGGSAGIDTVGGVTGGVEDDDALDDGGPAEPLPDFAGQADDGIGEDDCASLVEPAENKKQPADIIVVVDNSGSMSFEALSVQENLNGFSQQIIDSGIDVHVVLLSRYPGNGNGPNGEETGICIDPPLGSGGCPADDTNLPVFEHIGDSISSNDALEKLLYHEPKWKQALRDDAALHFVIVSDDESALDAASFDNQLKALDPQYADYELHGIVCTSQCAEAEAIGQVYIELGMLTGGIVADLCDQDFQPVFDQLATEVIGGATIACEWPIPEPPPGESFDPAKVNVEFLDGQGGGFEIGWVESEADCAAVADGWYYDDPDAPTMIRACPQTCDQIQGIATGTIEITLGCETLPAG